MGESEIEQSDPIGGARLVTDVMQCRHRCYRHVVGDAERASGKPSFASTAAFSYKHDAVCLEKAKTEQPPNEAGPTDDEQPVSAKRYRRPARQEGTYSKQRPCLKWRSTPYTRSIHSASRNIRAIY